MNVLYASIFLPILAGIATLFLKKRAEAVALCISVIMMIISCAIFVAPSLAHPMITLSSSPLSSGAFFAASIFTLMTIIYSLGFMAGKKRLGEYYGYILITLGAAAGAFFATDYLSLILFWGMLGATLYMLIGISGDKAVSASKKTFIIVGGTDALMIMGVGIIWMITKSLQIGAVKIFAFDWLSALAFMLVSSAALAKAGAMPFHSWIPDAAESAEVPVMAFLPASVDKLLGIYLLARISLDVFIMTPNSFISVYLLAIGSFTIIAAVLAALVQHDYKKLLSFHAISQVGYMVLGIGTAVPVGIAGAIFHMLNNAIYKSCLFMSAGSVEKQTGTTDLDKLGGLASFMPVTFVCTVVAALSISGVPPFNGFFSKWMIYQGIIGMSGQNSYWIIWLAAAMFGSVLTLASFIKLIQSAYLGQWSAVTAKAKDPGAPMISPMIFLASLCVIFGVFAPYLPIKYFVAASIEGITYMGIWQPLSAALLLIAGLGGGLVMYWIGRPDLAVEKPIYIGGELISEDEVKVTSGDFYRTVSEYVPLKRLYDASATRAFDIYEVGKNWSVNVFNSLSRAHNGIIRTYVAWLLIGTVLIFVLVR